MSDPYLEGPLSPSQSAWLLAALALAVIANAGHVAPWITLAALGFVAWRFGQMRNGWPLPGQKTRLAMAALALIGVLLSYRTINGADAGTALLMLMAALKLTEARSRREYFLLIVITYFLEIANFLDSQSIPNALLMLPLVLVSTAALLNITRRGPALAAGESLRQAGLLLGLSVPMALIMFVLFPRIPGPLWGISGPGTDAVSGLSDSMSPGAISSLVESDQVAFRVTFDGPPPPPEERYWRGPVLHRFDGKRWTAGWLSRHEAGRIQPIGKPIRYEVTLEANDQHWLFALAMPAQISVPAFLTRDYQLMARHAIKTRLRYRVSSYLHYRTANPLNHFDRIRDLYLPTGIDPRARALAAQWRRSSDSDQEIVNDALRMFRDQPFAYTLHPPPLSGDRIDDFLFSTRKGFCEHYAEAFTFLMRAAHIPARIVTGYQGGEMNPVGDYMIVRQSDAHAWSEVWLDGRGWVRVDPTAAVAPSRVERGIADALPTADRLPGFDRRGTSLLGNLSLSWDAVNNAWNQWVLGYGPELQGQFLARFGFEPGNWQQLMLALTVLMALMLLAVAGFFLWQGRSFVDDEVQRAYARFCRRLARRGLARASWEGPRDFALRVSTARPDLARPVMRITALYIGLRYGRGSPTDSARRLTRAVSRFRPRARAPRPEPGPR